MPITFKPTQTGLIGGALAAETSQGPASFALSGTGQAATAQLATSPPIVAFGGVAVGSSSTGAATFSNVGNAPLKINAEKVPGGAVWGDGPTRGRKQDRTRSIGDGQRHVQPDGRRIVQR